MATYTPNYPYAEQGSTLDFDWLATLNRTHDEIEQDIRGLKVYVDAELAEIRADIEAWKAAILAKFEAFKKDVQGQLDAFRKEMDDFKTYINNKVEVFENLTGFVIWKPPVANFAALKTTYPSAKRGWTVQTLDDNKVYYYDGSSWIWAMQYGVGNFNPYVFIEPAELKAKISAIALR